MSSHFNTFQRRICIHPVVSPAFMLNICYENRKLMVKAEKIFGCHVKMRGERKEMRRLEKQGKSC